jgi:hypothetical protein
MNESRIGPFSLEEINRQLAAGTLSLFDQAWYEGAAGWAPLSTVPGVSSSRPPSPAAAPTSGGPVVPTPTAGGPVTVSPRPSAPTEPLAIWSFVLSLFGLLGFCCGPVLGVAGVICGHMALSKIRARPELQGRGLAIAGLIIGYFAALSWLLYLIFFGGLAILQGVLENTSK